MFSHTKLENTQKLAKINYLNTKKTFSHTILSFFTQMYVVTEDFFLAFCNICARNLVYQILYLGMFFNAPKTRNRL